METPTGAPDPAQVLLLCRKPSLTTALESQRLHLLEEVTAELDRRDATVEQRDQVSASN